MTVAEARSAVRVAAAHIAAAGKLLDVALLQARFAEHDSALTMLEEAVRTEQVNQVLAMLQGQPARPGGHV